MSKVQKKLLQKKGDFDEFRQKKNFDPNFLTIFLSHPACWRIGHSMIFGSFKAIFICEIIKCLCSKYASSTIQKRMRTALRCMEVWNSQKSSVNSVRSIWNTDRTRRSSWKFKSSNWNCQAIYCHCVRQVHIYQSLTIKWMNTVPKQWTKSRNCMKFAKKPMHWSKKKMSKNWLNLDRKGVEHYN